MPTFNQIDQGGAKPSRKKKGWAKVGKTVGRSASDVGRRSKRTVSKSSKKVKRDKTPTISFKRDREILHKLRRDDTDTLAPLTQSERTYWKYRTSAKGVKEAATMRTERLYESAQDVSGIESGLLERVKHPVDPSENHDNALAWQHYGKIAFGPETTVHLGSPAVNPKDRLAAKRIALHEIAHLGQSDDVGPAVNEGRAERYENVIADKLGIRGEAIPSEAYRYYAKLSRALDPRSLIRYEQFED